MADIEDVTTYLLNTAASAVYPNGTSSPSIAPPAPGFVVPMDVRLFKGWPIADQIDLDLQGLTMLGAGNGQPPQPRPNGPCANVSVFPMLGMTTTPYQIENTETYVIVPPKYGLTVVVNGNQVTVTGLPTTGEYVTIIADRQFIHSKGGSTAAEILAALLSAIQVNYPTATLVGNTLTIPFNFQLDVRQGAIGTLGYVTHRQVHAVMVTVWAPNQATRAALASAIDVAIKKTVIATLPDTSQVKIVYVRTNVVDEWQNVACYRRDLIYECEYATLFTFLGYVVTSVTTDIFAGSGGLDIVPPTIPVIS